MLDWLPVQPKVGRGALQKKLIHPNYMGEGYFAKRYIYMLGWLLVNPRDRVDGGLGVM